MTLYDSRHCPKYPVSTLQRRRYHVCSISCKTMAGVLDKHAVAAARLCVEQQIIMTASIGGGGGGGGLGTRGCHGRTTTMPAWPHENENERKAEAASAPQWRNARASMTLLTEAPPWTDAEEATRIFLIFSPFWHCLICSACSTKTQNHPEATLSSVLRYLSICKIKWLAFFC
jgi:hypothetical protein